MPPKQNKCATVKKRERKTITLEVKSKVLKLNDCGISASVIGRQLNLSRTTVQTIIKDKVRLFTAIKNAVSLNTTIIRKRGGLIAEMEKFLIIWIQDQIQQQAPLSLAIIQKKALSIHQTLKKDHGDSSQESFTASRGWFMRFKSRYALYKVSVNEEASDKVVATTDKVTASNFPQTLRRIIEEERLSPKQIFNVDEIGLFWKKIVSSTYISQEEKSPEFEAANDRLTLLLGSNAEGDFKLKPLLIYSKNPRTLKNDPTETLPVIWKSNPKTWVTPAIFEEWFVRHFIPEVKKYCVKNNLDSKALLLIDNGPAQSTHITEIDPQIKVMFLPSNSNYLFQPMDQGVTTLFKAYYLRRIFLQAVEANEEQGTDLITFWKNYSILDGVNNIAASWDEVKSSDLKEAWKNVCPQFFIDNIQSKTLVDEVTADIVTLANNLPAVEITRDDIEDILASHSQELTDEDYIELDKESRLEPQPIIALNETSKDLTVKNLSEAFASLQKAMSIFEQNDPDLERSVRVNDKIIAAYQCYRELYENMKKKSKQSPTLTFFSKET